MIAIYKTHFCEKQKVPGKNNDTALVLLFISEEDLKRTT